MAAALDALPLARAKRELSIPESVTDDDVLLTEQIAGAVSFCVHITGYPLEDTDAADVDPLLTVAAVATLRHLYDGLLDMPHRRALFALLQPLVRIAVSLETLAKGVSGLNCQGSQYLAIRAPGFSPPHQHQGTTAKLPIGTTK